MMRFLFALGLLGPLLTITQSALAQTPEIDDFGPVDDSPVFESSQDMAVEIRIGPYIPNIDDEFASQGRTPFKDHFGTDKRWLLGFEVDWQLLRLPKLGSLGPGFAWGITSMKGSGFTDDMEMAKQKTTLSIMPMSLLAVLRIDALAQNTPVPLVPYGKVGLGYALWWTSDGEEIERAALDGRKGDDTSHGFVWALGGMLMLDVFNRTAASNLDATYSINHSYLFVEWFNSDLDGFDGSKMQVGVNTWMAGITLEM